MASIDPLNLFDTYKLYKAGTNKVTTWLASKAREANLLSDLFPDTSEANSKGKGRLKGKARAAKKASEKRNGQTHQIPLAAIPRIAKAIAGLKEQEVPYTIVQTLEDVIAARSACSRCFEGSTEASTQASNQTHQHFIGVLCETLAILKTLKKDPAQVNKIKSKSSDDGTAFANQSVSGLGNLFEHLEVDEPTEWSTCSSNLPPQSTTARCTYELDPTDEDISFAIFCLLKDMTDIRHYVRQTWAEYREYQITFTTAAVTMNTAISIYRRLNEEFLSSFPQFDDHGEIINYLFNGYSDPKYESHDQDFATYTGSNFKLSSKVFFCDLVYEILAKFFMGGEVAFYQQDQARTTGLRLSDDEEVLMKCLSLFAMANANCSGQFFNDQLIQALHVAKKDETVYTWVVFAVQLFVDTRRVVGKELNRVFDEAQKLRKWMLATLEQSLLFGQTNKVNTFYKQNDHLFQVAKEGIQKLLERDFMEEAMNEYLGDRADLYRWGSFYLFRNHPMILGLLTQYFLVHVHLIGIGLGGDQAAIITSIHLYNASQQSEQVAKSLEWIDLEKVIEWQDPSWLFLGDRPKLPGKCFKHYNLVMGVSAAVFSVDRRGKSTARYHKNATLPFTQKKNRKLKIMSTYVDLMYATRAQAKPGTPRWVPTRAAEEPLVMLELLVAKFLEGNFETVRSSCTYVNKDSLTRPKVHPLRMLSIFKDRLKSEDNILRFDLLTLNERCVEMLRKAQAVCVKESPLDYPTGEYDGDTHLNGCISHMLAGMAGVPRSQPTRFTEACRIVKEVIESEGSNEFEKANTRCFLKVDGEKIVIDNFKTPGEDNLLLSDRCRMGHFGLIIIADDALGFAVL